MSAKIRVSIVMLSVAIVLGYVFVLYRYYSRLTRNEIATLTGVMVLLLPSMILISREGRYKPMFPRINLGKMEWVLPILVFLSAFIETWFLGHTGLFTVVTLVCGLMFLSLSKPKAEVASKASLLLALIICVLYGVYTPTFGNDTWRDATQALQIIERRGMINLTIVHPAYPLPVVSILYAMHSIIAGLNTLWSSSIIGLFYLVLLSLWVYLAAKRLNTEYPHISVVLLLSVPLVVLWSVWFIPQAYALLMAIPLLFLDLPLAIILIFGAVMVLGHGGQALWTLIMLVLLVFAKNILKAKTYVPKSIAVRLIIIAPIFILYVIFTPLSTALKGAVTRVIRVIESFLVASGKMSLAGEKIASAAASLQRPVSSISGIIPIMVLVVLGVIVLIECRDILIRLLAFGSLAGLGVAFVGNVVFPALDLPRYLGLGSLTVLATLSPLGIQALVRRERAGTLYALLLVFLAVTSFGFSGALMPGNPYTANPYAAWSISGLITYDEAQTLEEIAPMLCCNDYLVDWRAGSYLSYKYLWIQPRWRGFYDPETQSTFTFAGAYEFYVTPEYLTKYNGVLIFRKVAPRIPRAFSPNIETFLRNSHNITCILYDSPAIKIYHFTKLGVTT